MPRRRLAGLALLALLCGPGAYAQSPTPSPTPSQGESAQDAIEERGGNVPAIFGYMIRESLQEKSGKGTAEVLRACAPILVVDLLLAALLVYRKAWRR